MRHRTRVCPVAVGIAARSRQAEATRIRDWTLAPATRQPCASDAARALPDYLDAFLQEHRRCGELDDGVESERVWLTCEYGASLSGSPLRANSLQNGGMPGTAPPTSECGRLCHGRLPDGG